MKGLSWKPVLLRFQVTATRGQSLRNMDESIPTILSPSIFDTSHDLNFRQSVSDDLASVSFLAPCGSRAGISSNQFYGILQLGTTGFPSIGRAPLESVCTGSMCWLKSPWRSNDRCPCHLRQTPLATQWNLFPFTDLAECQNIENNPRCVRNLSIHPQLLLSITDVFVPIFQLSHSSLPGIS